MGISSLMKLLTVLGISGVELWAGVPAGFAFQLHPLVIVLTSTLGAILGVVLVVLLGDRARRWLLRRYPRGEEGRQGRLYRIWERYGIVGLGLSAPLIFGAPLGAALGLMLGAPTGRLLFWMGLGITLWSVGLVLVGWLGMTGIGLIGL